MTIKPALMVVLAVALPAWVARAGIEEWCTAAEEVGDVLPSESCSSYLALAAEIGAAAAPCWAQISQDLPLEEWRAAREQCEAQAHLAVCGTVPCF